MRRAVYFIAALLLLLPVQASAQDNWDKVLDRYEQITERCLQLREKLEAGERVPGSSVSELLGELAKLRSQLKDASASMTPSQRSRFAAVRSRYDGSSPGESASREEKLQPKSVPGEASRKAAGARQARTETASKLQPKSAPGEASRKAAGAGQAEVDPGRTPLPPIPDVKLPDGVPPQTVTRADVPAGIPVRQAVNSPGPAGIQARQAVGPPVASNDRWSVDAAVCVQLNAEPAAGLLVAVGRGRLGGYVSARSNWSSADYSYRVTSGGDVVGGGLFWGSGSSRTAFISICAGPVWRPFTWLSLYAGAGYANDALLWQDIDGSWARVGDYGGQGLAGEGGAVFTLGRFDLLCGVWWQNRAALTLGAGWRF